MVSNVFYHWYEKIGVLSDENSKGNFQIHILVQNELPWSMGPPDQI